MTTHPTCRSMLCAGEAEHAARTALAAEFVTQIPLAPGMSALHRRALAARAAVHALRAGAEPGTELKGLWLDLAIVDLAEDLARATRRVSDLLARSHQPKGDRAEVTSTALD